MLRVAYEQGTRSAHRLFAVLPVSLKLAASHVAPTLLLPDEDDTESALGRTALGLGGRLAIPAAVAHYAGSGVAKGLAPFEVEPGAIKGVRHFTAIDPSLPSSELFRQYTQGGATLTGAPAVHVGGKPFTGADVIEKLRTHPVAKTLEQKGMIRPFTDDSAHHYHEFAKGPVPAAQKLMSEVFPGGVEGPLLEDLLSERSRAAQNLNARGGAAFDPVGFRNEYAKTLGERLPHSSPEEVKRLTDALESQMFKASPEHYIEHLKGIHGGQDVSQLQESLLREGLGSPLAGSANDVLGRALKSHAGAATGLRDLPAASQAELVDKLMKDPDLVTRYMTMKAKPRLHANLKAYARTLGPVSELADKFKGIRSSAQTLGQYGRYGLVGAGALGLGGAGALAHSYLKRKEHPEENAL
jgi:hypothetical protein